ncbi:MAG: hypothetical protein ACP5E8_06715 [Thermoplasmata archaeon]
MGKKFLYNLSTAIAKQYDPIIVKYVQGMQQNYYIAKNLSYVFFYIFNQRMKYKGEKYGKNVTELNMLTRRQSFAQNVETYNMI